MKKENNKIWSMNKNGEIVNEHLHKNNLKRFKADTPFDNSIVPYLIMIFCATVDGFVFYSLFSRISYDSPVTLGVQISGFLFGFDVVPIFIGIQYKRLRQGLTKDKFILIMALIVCGLVFAMNIALRIMTIDLLSPSPASNAISYMGEVVQENTESNVGSTAIALTIFGMGIPVVTSLGSCLISFITYNPLNIKKRRIAEMIEDNRDDIRRFDAIIADYDAEPDFAKYLEEEDEAKYQEMKMLHRALVISHCDYVRERLKEHLGNPTSNNVLSESSCETILATYFRGSYEHVLSIGLTKLRSNTLYPLSLNKGIYFVTIRLLVTVEIRLDVFVSRSLGSDMDIVLPLPLPPQTIMLLFNPVSLQSEE